MGRLRLRLSRRLPLELLLLLLRLLLELDEDERLLDLERFLDRERFDFVLRRFRFLWSLSLRDLRRGERVDRLRFDFGGEGVLGRLFGDLERGRVGDSLATRSLPNSSRVDIS